MWQRELIHALVRADAPQMLQSMDALKQQAFIMISRWYHLLIVVPLLVLLGWGCSSPEDSEPSTIQTLPYAVGTLGRLTDSGNVLNRPNEEAKADWFIQEVRIDEEGKLHLSMEFRYRGDSPDSLEFLGSAVLLELEAYYRYEGQWIGRITGTSRPLWFKPFPFPQEMSRQVEVDVTADFELPKAELNKTVPLIALRWLELTFVWIRAYQNLQGEYFYEWVSPSEHGTTNPDLIDLKVGRTYRELSGSFGLIYLPLPESRTHILDIPIGTGYIGPDTYRFDYVAWIKRHVLEQHNTPAR